MNMGMGKWKSIIIVACSIIFITLVSSFQFFWYIAKTPAGYIFPLIHNSVGDYYYYLSFIQQGMNGTLLAVSRYTSELIPGKPVFLFFTAIGFIGGLIKLDAPLTYTVFRFLFSWSLLGAIWFLVTRLLPGKNRWIALLIIFCTTPVWYRSPTILRQVGDFWSGIDPLMRIVFLPHHLFGNTAFILSLVFFDMALKQRSIKMGLIGSCLAFVSWLSNIALFPITISIMSIFFLTHISFIHDPIKRGIAGVAGLFIVFELLLYAFSFSSSTFPWSYIASWEQTQQYPLDAIQLLLMLGPMSIIAIGGALIAWKKSSLWQLIVIWFFTPFLFLVFQRYLPFSNVRFVQAVPYVPTGLLAYLAGSEMIKKKNPLSPFTRFGMFLIITSALYAIPSYMASVQNQLFCFERNSKDQLFYITRDSADIIRKLNAVGASDDVVLAPDPLPPLIPALSDKRVAYGMPLYTIDFAEKQQMGYEFFGGKLDSTHMDYLSKERVKFIIFEKSRLPSDASLQLLNCTKMYENATYFLCGRTTSP